MNSAPLKPLVQFFDEIKRLSFTEQEAYWNRASYLIEESGKKFPASAIKVFTDLFGLLDREIKFDIRDKLLLEIGPGYNLGVAFLAALSGAKKVYAVDAFPHPKGTDDDFIFAMLTRLLEERSFFFSEVKNFSDDVFVNHFARIVAKDDHDVFSYRNDKIELLFPYYAEKLPLKDDSFDLIYTNAAFEHFLLPTQAVQEMYRVTRPGGISFHCVDHRDHRNFRKPLDFLALEDDQWIEVFKKLKQQDLSSYSHTNRMRSSEVVTLFEEHGFKTVKVLPIPFMRCTIKDELFQRMTDHYKKLSRDDISILGCNYIFQK
jgi:SAM-dependent methyltransferase